MEYDLNADYVLLELIPAPEGIAESDTIKIGNDKNSLSEAKVLRICNLGFNVDLKINYNSLRKDLEQNQIIRKFGY